MWATSVSCARAGPATLMAGSHWSVDRSHVCRRALTDSVSPPASFYRCAFSPYSDRVVCVADTMGRSSDGLAPSCVVLLPTGGLELHDSVFPVRLGATAWLSSVDLVHQNRTTLTTQGMHKGLSRRLNPLVPFHLAFPTANARISRRRGRNRGRRL
jgi:hypothetical protein